MSTAWTRIARMLGIAIPTSIAVMAMGSGAAWAQETCPSTALDPNTLPMAPDPGYMDPTVAAACNSSSFHGCFRLDGSDTLTDVVHKLINASGACISYHNIGSTQAETNMVAADGGSAGTVNQGIGPMSRNFKVTVANDNTTLGTTLRTDWVAYDPKVVALDAGILSFYKRTGGAVNIDNVKGWPTACSGLSSCQSAITNHVTPLAVLVGGNPASGNTSKATTPECADPCRECLVGWLGSASQEGVPIEHILRRDDKSGTQDTFREYLNVTPTNPKLAVALWCNGKSEGNTAHPGHAGASLLNEDLDPIRKDCMAGPNGQYAATRCTYYPTSQNCLSGDDDIPAHGSKTIRGVTVSNPYANPLKCTQGLVVAISENDPAPATDITTSIGLRVEFGAGLAQGSIIGLTGLAGDLSGLPSSNGAAVNTAVAIDGITPTTKDNIYFASYALSRRLFLQQNPRFTDAKTSAGELPGRTNEELKVYNWVQNSANGCALATIVQNAGFLQKIRLDCSKDCTTGPSAGSTISCLKGDPGIGTPKQNIGAETEACDSNYPCVADGTTTGHGCTTSCAAIPVLTSGAPGSACNLSDKCSGGNCAIAAGEVGGCCGSCP